MPNLEVMEEMNEARKLEAAGAERSVPTLPGCQPDFPDSHILTLERPPKPKPDPTLSLWLLNMLAWPQLNPGILTLAKPRHISRPPLRRRLHIRCKVVYLQLLVHLGIDHSPTSHHRRRRQTP